MKTHKALLVWSNGKWSRAVNRLPRRTFGGGLYTRNWASGSMKQIEGWLYEVCPKLDWRPKAVFFEHDQVAIWLPNADPRLPEEIKRVAADAFAELAMLPIALLDTALEQWAMLHDYDEVWLLLEVKPAIQSVLNLALAALVADEEVTRKKSARGEAGTAIMVPVSPEEVEQAMFHEEDL